MTSSPDGWQDRPPDGTVGPDAVTGVGSGLGPGEPPGATPSTAAEIIETAAEAPASSRRSHRGEDVAWP